MLKRENFRQTNFKIYRNQNVAFLKPQCLCKSIQHNLIYKEAGVITPAIKVSSIFTNTLESGILKNNYLNTNRLMHNETSKRRKRNGKSRNISLNFRSNPKKYSDFESYEYRNKRPKIKRKEVSLNSLYNKIKKNHLNKSPCEDGSCRQTYDASKFFHCICDKNMNTKYTNVTRNRKNSKRKYKNTCLCYGTGDHSYEGNVIANNDTEYPTKIGNKNKVENLKYININEKNTNNECLCMRKDKQKNFVLCKCNKSKLESEHTKCRGSICKLTKKSSITSVKFKDKIIKMGNKYSQKFKRFNNQPFQNRNFKQNNCIRGLCDDINERQNFVCKCKNRYNIKECTEDTCNMRKMKYILKSKQSQTFRKETRNQETDPENSIKMNKKNRFIHYCHCIKAKFYKNISKRKNNESDVLKQQVMLKHILHSKEDQTGEPFFDIKVNPIDMRTLNPDEVRSKVMALGKLETVKTCICPSHNKKRTNFLLKTTCPGGVCKKAFKNKKINFTCTCAGSMAKICSDTTCNANVQMTQMSSGLTNESKPIFEMKLDSNNMNVVNLKEVRNKINDIEKSDKKSKLCPSGLCRESVTHNERYICKCLQRRRPLEIYECSDDSCRQTDLVQIKNNPKHGSSNSNNNKPENNYINNIARNVNNSKQNILEIQNKSENIVVDKSQRNIKSKISCICARILSKSENLSTKKLNTKTSKKSILKNHNKHTNKKQGLNIKLLGRNVETVNHNNDNLNELEKSVNEYGDNRASYKEHNINNALFKKKEEIDYTTIDLKVQNKRSNHKIWQTKLHEKGDKEDKDRSCYCCNCGKVKSDCRCVNTPGKLKCTDILCRSCSKLFRRRISQKPRYPRKQPILRIRKAKINMPSKVRKKHVYAENCVCCLCGQKSKHCTCEHSSKISKCKYLLRQSFSNFMRRYRQPNTYPRNGVTSKRTHIHKRKSVSIPIEKLLYESKIYNTNYGHVKTNKKSSPFSGTIDNKNHIESDIIGSKKRHRYVNRNKTILFPTKNTKVYIADGAKGNVPQLNKIYRPAQRDHQRNVVCTCSHICECELMKRNGRTKQKKGHKKRRLLNRKHKAKQKKERNRTQSQKQKKNKKKGMKRRKVWLADEKKFRKEVAKKEKVKSRKRLKQLKLEKKQLEAISKGQEEVEETSCLADFFLGLLKIGLCIIKGIGFALFKFITDPKGSTRYVKQRLKDPTGTYERVKKSSMEFWGLKKLQMLKSVAGSEKVTILSDTLENTALYQAFADKGKTKKENNLIEQKNKRRKRRIMKRDKAALQSCRHMLLHTLRKTPCLWVYHVCPQFYPQCLSCLAFWHNFSNLLLFLLAFIVWTPCIVCFEGFRALSCCLLCTS